MTRLRAALVVWLCVGVAAVFTSQPAAAQNTSGVFGPVVNEGHRSLQYRATYDLESHGFAQRVHYQQALNGDLQLRGIVQARKTRDREVDVDYFQGELLWQLADPGPRWRHALRFDLRLRTEGRPAAVGLRWTNEFDLDDDWRARVIVLGTSEIGDGASRDLVVQSRAAVTYAVAPGLRTGLEMFNTFGPIDDPPAFEAQRHQLGPTLSARLGGGWQLYTGLLFGLTDATSNAEGRIWLTTNL